MGYVDIVGRYPKSATIALGVILLLGSITFPSTTPSEAAPNPIPILSISLFPSQLRADVTNEEGGSVTFGGNVTVEQLSMMTSTVTLQAVVNTGWPVVISPQSFTIRGSKTMRFTVSVTVPAGTSSSITGNLDVTGSCKAPLLSPVVASASAVVTVRNTSPQYKWTVRVLEPVEGAMVDETITVKGTASYTGGNVTSVEIKMCTGPWVVANGTSEWTIEADASFLDDGPHTIFVRAKSAEATSPQVIVNVTLERAALAGDGPPGDAPTDGPTGPSDDRSLIPLLLLVIVIGGIGGVYLYNRRRRAAAYHIG